MAGAVARLAEDREHLLAVTDFLYFPNHHLHPDWVSRLEEGDVIGALRGNPHAEDDLADYLLERFELKHKLWFDFDSTLRRLLLRPRDDILRIVIHAGAVLNSRHARHAIRREDVLRLRAGFGEALFDFALNEAPLAFDLETLPRMPAPGEDVDVRAHLVASGLWCLGSAVRREPAAIIERLYLKMSTAEYPFLEKQPTAFRSEICKTVIEKLARRKLAL